MEWIEHNLFSCLFKAVTGWDCPGCGFQRSLLSLIKGDIQNSLSLYPATVPLLSLFIWSLVRMHFDFKRSGLVTRALLFLSAATGIISYALKLANSGS